MEWLRADVSKKKIACQWEVCLINYSVCCYSFHVPSSPPLTPQALLLRSLPLWSPSQLGNLGFCVSLEGAAGDWQ